MFSRTNPFLMVNPKSYLYGKKSLELAKAADAAALKTGVTIFFTCPFADIRLIKENTAHVIVTAQHMEALKPGRGMGHVLPESLKEAGAGAVLLNHIENQLTLHALCQTRRRAKELGMLTIICADGAEESAAVAEFKPDILLCEPTDLIGTGVAAGDDYIHEAVDRIKKVAPDVLVMIASGITTPEDCGNVIRQGADGTASTSGIVKAPDPGQRVMAMAEAIVEAKKALS